MEPLDVVKVFYEESVVGRVLVYDSGALGFAYDKGWLGMEGSFHLSATMPLNEEEFPDGVISPWLSNLLPEDRRMSSVVRVLGVPKSDSLAILKEIGGDTAGAVSVGEPSIPDNWTYESFSERYGSDFEGGALARHFEDLEHRPYFVGEDGVRISLAGGQHKSVLAVIGDDGQPVLELPESTDQLAIPKRGAPSTIIVKPDNPKLEGIVENEAYCLTLAGLIEIPAAECAVMQAGNRSALAVLRYDRRSRDDATVQRLHQEDFAQANGIYPGQKYEHSRAGLDLRRLLLTATRMSDAHPSSARMPATEILKLFDQVAFNLLVGNSDAHAKNYSMILSGKDVLMAPIYDVLSVPFWPKAEQSLAQRISGEKLRSCEMGKRHWDQIAEYANFNPGRVRRRVGDLIDKMVDEREEAIRIVSDWPGASLDTVRQVAEVAEKNALQIGEQLDDE